MIDELELEQQNTSNKIESLGVSNASERLLEKLEYVKAKKTALDYIMNNVERDEHINQS